MYTHSNKSPPPGNSCSATQLVAPKQPGLQFCSYIQGQASARQWIKKNHVQSKLIVQALMCPELSMVLNDIRIELNQIQLKKYLEILHARIIEIFCNLHKI